MYRFFLPLSIAAMSLPVCAQTPPQSNNQIERPSRMSAGLVEPPGPLTLEVALKLAVEANADLAAARQEIAAVNASAQQARQRANPTAELEVEDTRQATRETTFQVSQPIELGGKRAARIQAAARGLDAAAAELQTKVAEVRAAVTTAFFDVLAAQERMTLVKDSVEVAQRGTSIASKRVIAGKASPVEETKARVAESGVRVELLKASSDLRASRKRLTSLWRNPIPSFDRAGGTLDALPDLPQLSNLTSRLGDSPQLKRARIEVDRRQALATVERTRRVPDVAIKLGMKRSEELGQNRAIFGVYVPLPVFDRNQGNVLESLRRIDKARDELAATESRLDMEIVQAYERMSTSRQEAQVLREDILPGAQSGYDAAVTGFEFGKFSFLDVLDAQRTLLQAKSQYLRALSDAHRAAADIDAILGTSLHAISR